MHVRLCSIALTVLSVVFPVSGFAQTDNLEPALLRTSPDVVRTYAPASTRVHDDVALPPNLVIAEFYESTVELMRRRSPTFRRQCSRIASASELTVVLSTDPPPVRQPALAWTQISRRPGGLHATIRIGVPARSVELIAHEVEHIIEQLDGIDLAAKARLASTGVRSCACGQSAAFETSRAILIGARVADEVSRNDAALEASARLRH
jgi:hypothetical protein